MVLVPMQDHDVFLSPKTVEHTIATARQIHSSTHQYISCPRYRSGGVVLMFWLIIMVSSNGNESDEVPGTLPPEEYLVPRQSGRVCNT